ncbi:MAG: C25 family cysteine peptidase [Bacteroidales bacterium]
MKKPILYIYVLFVLIFSSNLNAQILIGQGVKNPNPIFKASSEGLSFSQSFSFLSLEDIRTEEGVFSKINMGDDFGTSQKVGMPELPTYSQLFELPYGADVEIEYSNIVTQTYSLETYGGNKIIPFQRSMSKSEDEVLFEINEKAYLSNEFFGNDLVVVEELGFMGGVRLARLSVSPIQYNPVSNSIIVVMSFDVNIRFKNIDIKANQEAKLKYNNQQSAFIGQKTINTKGLSASNPSSPIDRPLKMIILSDPMFENVLQPFIRWKREKGIEVIEMYKGQTNVGSTNQEMKAALQSLWNNASAVSPAADYLLICGDVQQIPAFAATTDPSSPAPTDLYYAEYTGDFLPDLFYGRFSAQTVAQMENIINKTIKYEKNLMQDNSYLKKTLVVAGRETNSPAPTCGNGQINYLKGYLQNNPNIDTLVYYNPASGSFSNQIRDSIARNGYSYINYTAHCDETGWASPSLSSSDVKNMNNQGKYSFYVNNCCLSSKFSDNECFAEAILRADNRGGIGAIGGSNYTYWYEDFYWSVGSKSLTVNPIYDANNLGAYDRLFHKNNEPFSKWHTTAGQIVQAGNLSVQQYGSDLSNYYWEVYHLMGDPSLTPYIGLPLTMTSSIPDSIPLGAQTLALQTQPYAFVGISKDGSLLGASQADSNGDVNIDFDNAISSMGRLKVVITNQFSNPLFDSIEVFIPNYPYLSISSIKYYDNQLEEVTELKNNEEYIVGLMVKNLGNVAIDSVRVKTTNLPNLFFSDSEEYIGVIGGTSEIISQSSLKIKIVDGTIDGTQIDYLLEIVGANNYYNNKTFSVEAFSPKLSIENIIISKDTINDLLTGERLTIKFDIRNVGRNVAEAGSVYLYPMSSNLFSQSDSVDVLSSLLPNASIPYSFNLIFDPLSSNNNYINFKVSAIANQYFNTLVYDSILLSGNVETFETGELTYFPWVNDQLKPWTIETNASKVYQGQYSLRSGNVSNSQKTTLDINIKSIYNDSISFYLKTSTENNYDKFFFYIDETLVFEKSGEKDWQRYAFAVNTGDHNYKWVYEKDYSTTSGSDAVWIDNINFPPDAVITSINNINQGIDNISVYPNPAQDIINISNLNTKSDIVLYDLLGRVKFSSLNKIISNINVSSLKNGVYYLSIKSDSDIINKKIIIAR